MPSRGRKTNDAVRSDDCTECKSAVVLFSLPLVLSLTVSGGAALEINRCHSRDGIMTVCCIAGSVIVVDVMRNVMVDV